MRRTVGFAVSVLSSGALWAQVFPVPVPGGDVVPTVAGQPPLLINIFSPGVGVGFDGLDADPHVFTNFRGVAAMGYTIGPASDNKGVSYQVITDIRVYRGDFVGATSTFSAGGTTSGRAHGTFVEI